VCTPFPPVLSPCPRADRSALYTSEQALPTKRPPRGAQQTRDASALLREETTRQFVRGSKGERLLREERLTRPIFVIQQGSVLFYNTDRYCSRCLSHIKSYETSRIQQRRLTLIYYRRPSSTNALSVTAHRMSLDAV
jgi:hypothetical protein